MMDRPMHLTGCGGGYDPCVPDCPIAYPPPSRACPTCTGSGRVTELQPVMPARNEATR